MKTEGGLFVGDITKGLAAPRNTAAASPSTRDWQDDGGKSAPTQQQQGQHLVYDDEEEGDYTPRYGYASHLGGYRRPS
jgi:hypothetical protein